MGIVEAVTRVRSRGTTALVSAVAVSVVTTLLVVGSGPGAADPTADDRPDPVAGAGPAVLPALRDWQPAGGSYRFGTRSRIVLATNEPALRRTARTLVDDLAAHTDARIPIVYRSVHSRPGDIVLGLDPGRTDLGDEGYQLIVSDVVRITGATDDGAFYGTRTLLQALADSNRVAAGRTVDVPRYPERGVEICPCMVKLSMPRMERLFREMAYLKLNYLLLPLKMISDTHPETNQWSYYTRAEARQLAAWGAEYHVDVVPEINAPGHMEPFLFDRPDLQLADSDGHRTPTRMDITKDEAFSFYIDLIDEYVDVFPGSSWHLGADEYMTFSDYAAYPQIGAYAREKFGPDARPEDAFIDFINRINRYVRQQHGRTLRIWNDGLPRRNIIPAEQRGPHPRLDTDIVIEHWLPGGVGPREFAAAGHPIVNAASSLYEDRGSRPSPHSLCPNAATLQDCVRPLWETGWGPAEFEDGTTVDSPRLTGSHLSIWQTDPDAETERQVEHATALALRLLAQRTWGATEPFISYQEFVERVETIGPAPGYADTLRPGLGTEGQYLLRNVGVGPDGFLAPRAQRPGGGLLVGRDVVRWQLRRSSDGYYRLESPSSGLCIAMELADGPRLLESDPGVGAAPELQPCEPAVNSQKWEISGSGRSGYSITNALSQLRTRIESDGTLVQDVPDRPHARWRLTRRTAATVGVHPARRLLEPAQPNRIRVSYRNHGDGDIHRLELELTAPTGWRVRPDEPAPVGTVRGGEAVHQDFRVTPPAGAAGETAVLSAAGTPSGERGRTSTAAARVRVDPIWCRDPDVGPPPPDDEFGGIELDGCRWTRVVAPNLSTMEVHGGRLHILTHSGDLAGGPPDDAENIVLQAAPGRDWTIETKMQADLEQSYQQGGLIAHADDDDYVEFVLVTENAPGDPPNLYLSLVSEIDGEFGRGGRVNLFGPEGDSDDVWWLRLSKSGDTYSAAYSADGKSWTAMPNDVRNGEAEQPFVGLLAAGPLQQSSTDVWFDHFRSSR